MQDCWSAPELVFSFFSLSFSISLSPRWKGSSGSARRTIGSDRHSNVCCMPKKEASQESRNVIAKPSRTSRGARLNGPSACPKRLLPRTMARVFVNANLRDSGAFEHRSGDKEPEQWITASVYSLLLNYTVPPFQIAHPRGGCVAKKIPLRNTSSPRLRTKRENTLRSTF